MLEEERDPALRKAQDLACDILNLSQSDIQNLMSCTEDDEDDNTHIPEVSWCMESLYKDWLRHSYNKYFIYMNGKKYILHYILFNIAILLNV